MWEGCPKSIRPCHVKTRGTYGWILPDGPRVQEETRLGARGLLRPREPRCTRSVRWVRSEVRSGSLYTLS